MDKKHEETSKIFKALSDPNRLEIIEILSCGEKCACDILEKFEFTQPTLSHHMKVLIECEIVKCRKDGLWSYYSLNVVNLNKLTITLMNIYTDKADCICKSSYDNKSCD